MGRAELKKQNQKFFRERDISPWIDPQETFSNTDRWLATPSVHRNADSDKKIIISPVTSDLGWLLQAREEYRSKEKELSFQHCNSYHL